MSKLYFRYGAMGCGKSTEILQIIHNYKDKEMKALLLKPSIDTKKEDYTSSRIGISQKVDFLIWQNDILTDKLSEYITNNQKKVNAIVIDEAQFLTKAQVNELYYITKKHFLPVLCYGLRCDFRMEGFEGSTRLLQIADDIKELKTICTCGSKATINIRYYDGKPTFEGEQIIIDNTDSIHYSCVCGKCYLECKNKETFSNRNLN